MTHLDVVRILSDGLRRAKWSTSDLWIASLALGGRLGATDVGDIASGRRRPVEAEYELLAVALNEHLGELDDEPLVPFWSELIA